jgi:hypothetical protein
MTRVGTYLDGYSCNASRQPTNPQSQLRHWLSAALLRDLIIWSCDVRLALRDPDAGDAIIRHALSTLRAKTS